VKRCLVEAKKTIEGSKSKEKLLEVVENLRNALKEYRKHEILRRLNPTSTHTAFTATALVSFSTQQKTKPRRIEIDQEGLPIIDERIKGILAEIQDKAKALCTETRGTAFESLGKDVNNAGRIF